MSLVIGKNSKVILRKARPRTNTIIDRADSLFNMLVIKAVVEATLELPAGTLSIDSRKVMFYPVWTMKHDTKEKIIKKIAVKIDESAQYKFIDRLILSDYGLTSYEELLSCFVEAGAIQRSGVQDFYKRFRANHGRNGKE